MFYKTGVYNRLRFRDIIKGFPIIIPNIEGPFNEGLKDDYDLDINISGYSVVIDPCSKIENKSISISPLLKVNSSWFENPYFKDDILKINDVLPARYGAHPQQWNRYSYQQKLNLYQEDARYPHSNFFIFDENPQLPLYEINGRSNYEEILNEETNLPEFIEDRENWDMKIRYHLINFKKIFHISCNMIKNARDEPINEVLIKSKILELSIDSRISLRNKLTSHFGYVPIEDTIE